MVINLGKKGKITPIFSADILIKTLRKQKNLTQAQLVKGICSQETLSRIERGERMPERETFDRLMQRLGQNPRQYYSVIVSSEDKFVADIKTGIDNLVVTKKYDEALSKLKEIETLEPFKHGYNLQCVFHSKAACLIGMPCDEKMLNEAYELCIKALNVTIPDFEESKIDTYVLGYPEIISINTLAIIRDKMSGIEKATEIFMKLKESMLNNYIGEFDKEITFRYLPLLFNISRNLRRLERFDESIAICDEGIALSEKHFYSYQLPKFIATKSACLFALEIKGMGGANYRQTAVALFERACHLFIGLERFTELEGMKKDFKEMFDVETNF